MSHSAASAAVAVARATRRRRRRRIPAYVINGTAGTRWLRWLPFSGVRCRVVADGCDAYAGRVRRC